jgi:hypothetical protein
MVGYNHKITTFRVERIDPGINNELTSKAVIL